jgi:hypothetical protein
MLLACQAPCDSPNSTAPGSQNAATRLHQLQVKTHGSLKWGSLERGSPEWKAFVSRDESRNESHSEFLSAALISQV